jgi:hypothetical protein
MKELLERGYVVRDTREILNDPEKIKEIKGVISDLISPNNIPEYFKYRANFEEVPYSSSSHISVSEIENEVKKHALLNRKPTQRWMETNGNQMAPEMFNYVKESIESYASKIYDIKPGYHMHTSINLTLYVDSDFIDPHRDGQNEGRLAIFLIYMTEPEKYNDGGGKLIITDDGLHDEIIPTFGKFVVLDFTKNNVNHAVEPVKNGFKRTCFLAIVSEKEINE